MKIIYRKITLASLLFCFVFAQTGAQRSNGLAVEGKINVQQGSVEGAIIQMFQDGRRMDNYGVGADGSYKVELNYNHKYELIFSRQDNFPQKIVVETAVPNNILQSDPRFPPFPLDINLFAEIPGIDRRFSENTVLKIYYSPNVDNFISELYYNDAQIAKLIEQAVLQSQLIGKEADYLSKLTKAELAELRKEYNQLLEQAGKEYSEEKFLAALDGFKAASKIFPQEQFPKDRIAEINDLLGLMMVAADLDKALSERYTALIKEADVLFNGKKYADAKNSYNRALSIKPNEAYPNAQIKLINDLLKQQLAEGHYNELIAQADNSFKQVLYTDALAKYQEALQLKSNEAYPKSKIEEINGILAKQTKDAEKQESYKQAMLQGEAMYEKQFYDKSIASFETALKIKPGDEPATKRIAGVKAIMKEISDKMQFDELVKSADKLYKKQQLAEALADYSKAADLISTNEYVNKKIDEINGILQLKENFADLVFKADNQFNAEKYTDAKNLYVKALEIRTDDKHSLDRVKEIDGKLAAQNLDKQYNAAIAQADEQFTAKNYEDSKVAYTGAVSLKPKEKYPKDKIAEINGILQQLAKTESDYQRAIAKADDLFQQKDYENAKTAFADAGNLKPAETYPPEMIGKIDVLLAEQAQIAADAEAEKIRLAAEAEAERLRLEQEAAAAEAARLAAIQAEKDKNYSEAIAKADNFFDTQEYENARTEYRTALNVKPEESYPQTRIDEIGALMAQLSAAQKAYEDAVKIGDREFKAEKFDAAKTAFNTAMQAKAGEAYPVEMVEKIDSIVETRARLAAEAEAELLRLEQEAAAAEATRLAAIQAEKDKSYSEAIAKADNFFDAQEYENARNEYRAALNVKPEESYPQTRIDEIGALLAQLSAAQKAYEDAVKIGDREFKAEKFDAAKTAFNTAMQAKTEETYPVEMVAKIDLIVETRARLAAEAEAERLHLEQEAAAAEAARLAAIQAEKDKNYSEAIAKADNYFDSQDYENARNEYRAALNVKPDESYPQTRIDEIGALMAQLSAAQKAYEDAVKIGDREFKAEKFDAAKTAFNTARQAKTDETYPVEMVAKIDSIVETRARLAAEAEAERLRLEQEAAAAEAARLAALQAEKDKNYSDAIAKADNFFDTQEYENARNEYRAALNVKPDETYPQTRIDEIGGLMAQLSAAQKAYEDAVKIGDREFKAEKFDAAKTAFNTAMQAKIDETYPVEMVAKIDSIVETRARLAAEAEAERLRLEQEAAAAEAARLAAIQAEKDKNYSDAVAKADNFFDTKEYENARNEYRAALNVKPEETYPQTRIDEIGALMAQISAAQKAYEDAVKIGDREFKAEKFDAAKTAFNTAMQTKADEAYPVEMVAKIDSIVETRARLADEAEAELLRLEQEAAAAEAARLAAIQAEKDKNYSEAIAKADNFFDTKEYENARNEYRAALNVKPEETYPQTRIDEIGKLLADLLATKKEQELLDKNYLSLIQQADRFFTAKNYEQAKGKYSEALILKPKETHPTERIAEIDRFLEQQALDEKYRTIIVAADAFFKTEKYVPAKKEYENAINVKPAEQYPKSQISKIDAILAKEQQRILAEKQAAENLENRSNEIAKMNEAIAERGVESEAELNVLYNELVKQADALFDTKQYNVSRGWYYKAWDVKPNEKYPPQRIDEINRLVGGLLSSQLDRDYQSYVDLADSTFRENQYALARGWYNRALSVKAAEKYPKDQLAEIEKKIAERMAGQSGRQFDNHVEKASKALEAKNYNVARFWYRKALELRPNDADVNEKLQEISDAVK